MNRFPEECFESLGCYVYRLIDPRNGKTFYIGREKGMAGSALYKEIV